MINGMRKARIPDMTLPKYEITRISEGSDFDPLDGIDDMNILMLKRLKKLLRNR